MAESKRQSGAYTKSEMVRISVDGEVLPDPVPETWIGTDLLPAGAKKATKAQVDKADDTDDGGGDTAPPSDSDSGS